MDFSPCTFPFDVAANPFWRFGAAVLGPVFNGFAQWIIEQAQAEGETTVEGWQAVAISYPTFAEDLRRCLS